MPRTEESVVTRHKGLLLAAAIAALLATLSFGTSTAGAAPGEWGVLLASDDVRDAALALTAARVCRDRARTAVLIGGLTQALGALTVAFGIAAPALVPVLGVLAAAAVVSVIRPAEA